MSQVIKVTNEVESVDIDTGLIEQIINRAKKNRVKLDQWYWDRPRHLAGNAINHPRLGNAFIKTSVLVHFDEKAGIAESQNTVYELGARKTS